MNMNHFHTMHLHNPGSDVAWFVLMLLIVIAFGIWRGMKK